MPILGNAMHAKLIEHLKSLAATLSETPKAVLVISAHWEVPIPSLWFGGVLGRDISVQSSMHQTLAHLHKAEGPASHARHTASNLTEAC